jgi:hypothetical protein
MELAKDRTRIGMLCSHANPPNMMEFLTALEASNKFLIDRLLYAVTDGRHHDDFLVATKRHRYAMAKLAVKIYDPLITFTDLGDFDDSTIDTTVMTNGQQRFRTDGEDYAFRLFGLNPNERFTLVFMTAYKHCRRVDDMGRDDTINKLLANIKYGLYGFDPDFHNVIALFIGDRADPPSDIRFDRHEQALVNRGIFTIECMKPSTIKGIPTEPKELSRVLRHALDGRRPELLILLGHEVYDYIETHPDYKQRLVQSLSA